MEENVITGELGCSDNDAWCFAFWVGDALKWNLDWRSIDREKFNTDAQYEDACSLYLSRMLSIIEGMNGHPLQPTYAIGIVKRGFAKPQWAQKIMKRLIIERPCVQSALYFVDAGGDVDDAIKIIMETGGPQAPSAIHDLFDMDKIPVERAEALIVSCQEGVGSAAVTMYMHGHSKLSWAMKLAKGDHMAIEHLKTLANKAKPKHNIKYKLF